MAGRKGNSFALARHIGGEDSTFPNTAITSGPSGFTSGYPSYGEAEFEFSSTKARSTFECKIDDKPYRTCYERYGETYYLADGSHTFRVRATDAIGRTDPLPVERSFFVDTWYPEGTVKINGGDGKTTSRKVTLKLTKSDHSPSSGVVKMRLKNKGGDWTKWQPYKASKAWYLSAGKGYKDVYVQYMDRAGNISYPDYDWIYYQP